MLDYARERYSLICADLSGANLAGARIGGAVFIGARLIGADLSGVNAITLIAHRPTRFDGADLTEARLKGAQLAGAVYDGLTRFPRRFNVAKAGLRRAKERDQR